jgi:hypothetical protein
MSVIGVTSTIKSADCGPYGRNGWLQKVQSGAWVQLSFVTLIRKLCQTNELTVYSSVGAELARRKTLPKSER